MQEINELGPMPAEEASWTPQSNTQRKSWSGLIWVVLFLLLIFTVVLFIAMKSRTASRVVNAPHLSLPAAATPVSMPSPAELSNSFREIAKSIKPSVVNINTKEAVQGRARPQDLFSFGFPDSPRREGTGSGMIVTPDGYILTNNHVVDNAVSIEVTLSDRRTFKARVIGTDKESDIAVIKIDAGNLPVAVLGDSDQVQQGDWVLALGSPFGLEQTVTAGIVSAIGRELAGPQYSKFIQTDASINPGNSGGPLVAMDGRVIGINTVIFTRSGGSEGVGFAIASNLGRQVFNELVKKGRVTRGYLGIRLGSLDAPKAKALRVEEDAGVLVQDVSANTPASRAGFRSGDIVTSFNGVGVHTPRELTDIVAATSVGQSVRVDLVRDGKPLSVTVEVAERPDNLTARAFQPAPQEDDEQPPATLLGIVAQTVTTDIADRLKLRISSGALVRSVQPNSPAAEAGISHGDVIHRLDQTEIRTVEDLAAATRPLQSGDHVAIQIEHNGQLVFITLALD
jgi:serine protease Do